MSAAGVVLPSNRAEKQREGPDSRSKPEAPMIRNSGPFQTPLDVAR